jgi:uncharacterized lipoprotein YmbA
MRVRGLVLSLVAAAVVASGCVGLRRSPQARFFVLRSVAEPAAAVETSGGLLGVMPVRIPGHLERPQLVTWVAPGELRIDEFLRWGEPLDAGLTRTLSENLQSLLPEHFVVRSPWPSRTAPALRVVTELTIFGLQPGGEVLLEGRWALLPVATERPLVARSTYLRRGPLPTGPSGTDPAAQMEALSELIGDLGREIATAVRTLPDPAKDAAKDAPPGR